MPQDCNDALEDTAKLLRAAANQQETIATDLNKILGIVLAELPPQTRIEYAMGREFEVEVTGCGFGSGN